MKKKQKQLTIQSEEDLMRQENLAKDPPMRAYNSDTDTSLDTDLDTQDEDGYYMADETFMEDKWW